MSEINDLAARIHEISTDKGFTPPSLENLPEKLMLSVSELSEAMEEHRGEKPLVYYESLGEGNLKLEGVLVEIADSIIRNLHMMHSLILEHESKTVFGPKYDIFSIIKEKVDFNEGRPSMHGKAY